MQTKQAKITIIGSYAVGMTMECKRFPQAGETVKGCAFKALHGGKGSNQAIAVARLGGKAFYGGCIGRDNFGQEALNMLEQEGIDIKSVKQTAEASTGVGFITVDESGRNEIVIDFGANDLLFPEDVEKMEKTIAASDLLLVQLEANNQAVARAIELAHKNKVPAILNPAPFCPLPDEIVRKTSYITPNETEAAAMLKLNEIPAGAELARKLHEKYGVTAIVTLGEKGAYIKNAEIDKAVPGLKMTAIDTTGAGDTFSGAFAVALGEGKDLETAVTFANKAAALSVTVKGVVESIPYRQQVDRL